MTNSSVDILLPYWGEFSLVKKTIDSIIAQTHVDWHLYIVDDCYPSDEARNYVRSLSDSRISFYKHKENIGITNNFNFTLRLAKSRYCVMIGCDDIMLPNYLQTALQRIGNADFYQPGVEVIDENDNSYLPLGDKVKKILQPKKSGLHSGEKLARSLSLGNWLYFPSIMWRTETIKAHEFNTMYKIVEDLILEMDIIIAGGTLYYDKETTFQYRRFANSLSSREKTKGGVRFSEEATAYRYLQREFSKIGWKRAALAAKLRVTSRIHEIIS